MRIKFRAAVDDSLDRNNAFLKHNGDSDTSPHKMTGEELHNVRKALGLTQAELADILKVTTVTIWRAEKRKPSRELLALLQLAMKNGVLSLSDKKMRPENNS